MGVVSQLFGTLFGSGRNVIVETAQVFTENTENSAARAGEHRGNVMGQYAAEFARPRAGLFDRFIDGLNRLPRPFMAFGVLGLFIMAMVDPVWFAQRMVGVSLVPEPLWWLMGAIVSFYFGARYQAQGERFQRDIATTVAQAPHVARQIEVLGQITAQSDTLGKEPAAPGAPVSPELPDAPTSPANPALRDWRATLGTSHAL